MLLKARSIQALAVACFLAIVLCCQLSSAQDHVVPTSRLHQALVSSASTRQHDIAKVQKFFSSPPVRKALKKGGINAEQVQQAIPSLSAQELAQLSSRTGKIQNDFAAGALSNEQLTYIVIAIAVALIVVLIFEA